MISNVRIKKYPTHYAVYKGNMLVGVASSFPDIWAIARGVV